MVPYRDHWLMMTGKPKLKRARVILMWPERYNMKHLQEYCVLVLALIVLPEFPSLFPAYVYVSYVMLK